VIHPNGNIAEHLVASGLARIVDWHAGLMGAQGMERLRATEKTAKERRLCLYASLPGSANKTGPSISNQNGKTQAFDGIVTRIWSGDQISVLDPSGKERRLQLSSIRAPKSAYFTYSRTNISFICKPELRIQNKHFMHPRPKRCVLTFVDCVHLC
jgi:staphylococcal nuclease domain-containing protein 1